MNKVILILLVLGLFLCLCACGDEQKKSHESNNNASGESTSQPEEEALILSNLENGTPMINIKRFRELLSSVELTAENWTDYIEVCTYTKEDITRDDFGEIISTKVTTCYELGAKGNKHYNFRDFVIELKSKTTGELVTYKGSNEAYIPEVKEDFRLEDYECTRIKGTLYFVDVPEEAVFTNVDSGRRLFAVGYNDILYGLPYNCYLPGTDGRRIAGMFDFLVYN